MASQLKGWGSWNNDKNRLEVSKDVDLYSLGVYLTKIKYPLKENS